MKNLITAAAFAIIAAFMLMTPVSAQENVCQNGSLAGVVETLEKANMTPITVSGQELDAFAAAVEAVSGIEKPAEIVAIVYAAEALDDGDGMIKFGLIDANGCLLGIPTWSEEMFKTGLGQDA